MQPIDVDPRHIDSVRRVLSKHLAERKICTATAVSDFDLVIMGVAPIAAATLAALADEFAKSGLPFKVDIVAWASLSEEFRRSIEQHAVWFAPRGN